MTLTPERISELKELAGKATPGPWAWFGNAASNSIYLATTHSGRRFVMDFVRWGFRGAQPRFQAKKGIMVNAADLIKFAVGDPTVTGVDQAKKDSSVYRFDIRDIDSADARYIAAIDPATLTSILEEVERLREVLTFYRDEFKPKIHKPIPGASGITSPLSSLVSHEEPAGDTQGALPVTDETQPAIWVSAAQLAEHVDPDPRDGSEGGNYLPARKTRRGLFQTPLYTHPAALVSPPDNGEAATRRASSTFNPPGTP